MIPYLRVLSEGQLGYIAAMFDGEGYFSLAREVRKQYGSICYHFTSGVTNTNPQLLIWLKETTQIGVISPSRQQKQNHKSRQDWRLRYRDSAYLIPLILPYLVIKNQQALLSLEYLSLDKRTSRWTPESLDVMTRKQSIFETLQELNRRGI